jgi:uncharacterized membrane protein YfcA
MHWIEYVLLLAAAAMAGAVNSVAGGGTLLTFPALLWTGQLAIVANATSTVALVPGALSSFWGYRSELSSSRRELALLAIPSFAGGALGALLLLWTSNEVFERLVPFLILLATLLFITQERLARWLRGRAARRGESSPCATGERAPAPASSAASPQSRLRWTGVLVFQFFVGLYGGYFGAGIGILMLAAFGFLGFTNIHHMNALKNLCGTAINSLAAAMFIYEGLVDWRLALLMAVGAVVGGYAGAGTARRIGQRAVRRTIIVIGFSLSAWLLIQQAW